MDARRGRKKQKIELRYYELPEHEPALALQGEEWVRTYGTRSEALHFHNLMEIGVCHWGEGEMVVDDQTRAYSGGAVTMIPANCLHTTLSKEDSLNDWAYLFVDPERILKRAFPDEGVFVDAAVRRLNSGALYFDAKAGESCARLIELILAEYREQSDYHDGVVQSLLVSLLLLFARKGGQSGRAPGSSVAGLGQIMPAIEYIDKNYMNPVSIAELAAQCSLSEAHLRRKFKEYMNMSPVDHLTLVRMRRGCELLNTTSLPVPEVALRVGYQSVSSFSRNFQKLIGTTPYHYKKLSMDYRGKLMRYNITAKKGWAKKEDS